MNGWLKQLIDLSGDYDYAWFIAILAWCAVAIGAWGRRDRRESWLIWLAGANVVQATLELTLYANDIRMPYLGWDFVLGLSQAVGIAALWWPLAGQVVPVRRQFWRVLTLTAGLYLGVTRFDSPIYGGLSLALASAGGVWAVIRSVSAVRVLGRLSPRELRRMRLGLLAVAVLPIVSTFGPLAYAMDLGRRDTDFSPFELIAAVANVVAAVWLASALWAQRLRAAPGASESAAKRWNADLRLGFTILIVWLVFGLALAVANGRQARADFEQSLLLRARTAAALLDQTALRAALGPNFKPGQIRTVHRQMINGKEAQQVYVPWTEAEPSFSTLRSQLRQLLEANQTNSASRFFIWLMVIRDGKAICAAKASDSERPHPWKNIIDDPALADEARLAKGGAFLEGPVTDEWGSRVSANAPVMDTATGRPLGWLSMTIASTAWATTFAMARLQAMFVTAIGVALWVVAVMFWLRRSERELAMQQAEQSEAADRAKSQFLAQVSHELRAPLQGIYGYTDLIEMTPLDVHQQDLLTSLRGQSTLMLRLVNDLVDLGALQAGAFRLNPEEVDLHGLVAECLDSVRTRAEAKNLEISCQLHPSVPGQARTDGARLRQVLLNLLGNAVKYTHEGSIKLRVQRCDPVNLGLPVPEWARVGVWVEFGVIDTGPGIAPEDQQRIFEPFIRLERDLAEQGAGLGLALTGRLCHALGGNVHVESDGEHGSSFIARLPFGLPTEPATGEKRVTEPGKAAWPGLRVLVADDNTLMRELLCSFLRSRGARVTEACDGLTAVEECRERMFDVVLLDISMPWLDGHAAIQRLRAPRGARGQPWVIGLSAHAGPEEEARALAGGMNCFLVKPMPLTALAEAMFAAPAVQRVWRTAGAETEETAAPLRERLLEIYARETPRVVDKLRGAAQAHDWPALRSLAHYLQNSADALGAGQLRRCCRDLESAAEKAADDSVGPLLTAVELAANEPLSFRRKQPLVHVGQLVHA